MLLSCSSSDIFPSIGTNLANPLSITIDSAAARAYLVNSNNKILYDTGSFQVLDISSPASPALLSSVEIPSFSGHAYLDAAAGYIYLTNRLEDNILRINTADLGVESFSDGSNPFGIAYDAVSSNLYMATTGSVVDYFALGAPEAITSVSIAALNISDGSILTTSSLRDLAIIGRQAFISRTNGGVFVFDMDENNIDYYISDITSPRGIVTDGTYIYLASVEVSETDETLVPTFFAINPAALTPLAGNVAATLVDKDDSGIVTASIEIGTDPQEVIVGTDYIFVSNYGADTVSVINRAALAKTTDITVGDEPFGMAIYSPGGTDTHLYVTNVQDNSISIIDIASLAVAATF